MIFFNGTFKPLHAPLAGVPGFGPVKMEVWDKATITTILEALQAIKDMFPKTTDDKMSAILHDVHLAILNYMYHPIPGTEPGSQKPYQPLVDDDLDFLKLNHTAFYDTVCRTVYNSDPLEYRHSGCPQEKGACGEKYKILESCPRQSNQWIPYQYLLGKVPEMAIRTILEFLGKDKDIYIYTYGY
jgi:hypothetical protein